MAPARSEYEVVPTGTAWEIKRDGQDFLAVQTKQVAVDEAVFQASRNTPSHVVVRRLDGGIEDEANFGDAPQDAPAGQQQQQQPPAQQQPAQQQPAVRPLQVVNRQ